ncbi:hypothetical protein PIB30_019115 [Stylosanthes scabra]|uniref:Uncharacterized protein n=1 Tax=Stylosanthes scabra TaxID=79078 RepID=A0ABU6V8A3_9FABA|nr:hypothetical protein [Stylosanthes scabra]
MDDLQELNTIMIASRDVENDIEFFSVESSDAEEPTSRTNMNYPEEMARATRLLGVELPIILEANIQGPSSSRSKIQKVPALLLQDSNFTRYCSPKMISFGPIHHRRQTDDLQLGQQFKCLWAFRYIEQFASIEESVDEELTQMLFVDGCALLYFMDNIDDQHPESLMLKLDQLLYIWRDVILLENQLPVKLLDLLITGAHGHDNNLKSLMFNFLFMGLPKKNKELAMLQGEDVKDPTHLLDYIRSYFFYAGKSQSKVDTKKKSKGEENMTYRYSCAPSFLLLLRTLFAGKISFQEVDHYWHRYKNIGDLRKAGIRVKASKTEWRWGNISFTSNLFSGKLMLPGIVIDDTTPYFYHNLVAYEMCPDFHNNFEFCSYFSLMDSFIDDAEDVKELRAAGILQNLLGNDEEVAKLFNELGNVLPSKLFNSNRYSNRYVEVKRQIDAHYRNKWKTWLAQARSTYFNTPWSHIAFYAAVLALVLTSIQTWYAINPKN